jgi:SNF2 family DNA or RNA helicase
MAKLEALLPGTFVRGILPDQLVTIISTKWFGDSGVELTFKAVDGKTDQVLKFRDDEDSLELVEQGRPWSFDGDGNFFKLTAEAMRIRLAHLFDPLLAVHTSDLEPLPHQITAVYESMLPRQPLRFLLADDPGAGKTIMAGLLIKELIARGDLQRCLIVCPGSLAGQWQDELEQRFQLPFEILTNDKLEASRTGNWFQENNLVIARLDKLSRNEDLQEQLKVPDALWDLIVCDEAHKFSASIFGGEIYKTKRYRLGQLLSTVTRHFLLMTATPHNGKEEDFQLFMALLDGDRFEGKFRDGSHSVDVRDLMRRMVKEHLLKFDGKPLFPERKAHTLPFKLSELEAELYASVTAYVREEFNRADKLQSDGRRGTVGFALTILQRRLASSPAAILASLTRRRERLESRLKELELIQRGGKPTSILDGLKHLDAEEFDDFEDLTESDVEELETQVLDLATAAQTIDELKKEINTLKAMELLAKRVVFEKCDTKWVELSGLLNALFSSSARTDLAKEELKPFGSGEIPPPKSDPNQKVVLFTEHRDTLTYLSQRIRSQLGREESVIEIHGGMGRTERKKAQEQFKFNPDVKILLATDAAGEGINLQRAHLMVNYDLPWNPNRLEQRFGRIHRIGQTEVCHLFNLIANETREGDVYEKLLNKLEQARQSLGGQVFDVLGRLEFEGRRLRDLLIEAIRYGEREDVKLKLETAIDGAIDLEQLRQLMKDGQLVHDVMDTTRIQEIREDMDRAEARRLQPHYIEEYFQEAFARLGGKLKEREPKRFQISRVPAKLRNRERLIGHGKPVLDKYERVVFEKDKIKPQGQPDADFLCPGHPLLDAVLDLTLEEGRDLLKRGTILVDDLDMGRDTSLLFFVDHALTDASLTREAQQRVISRQMHFIRLDSAGNASHLQYAPYLDYRPLESDEPSVNEILSHASCKWIGPECAGLAETHAVASIVPEHTREVRDRKHQLVDKAEAAVKERLAKEINYWDQRARELKAQEVAGKPNAKLNSQEAQRRADTLQERLARRLLDLKRERQISPKPPVVAGGLLIVPKGLLLEMQGKVVSQPSRPADTMASAARARKAVMQVERKLGHTPVDREFDHLGYDLESRDGQSGQLRFIEVKGRVSGADTVTVTRNEILFALNKPEQFILALVEFQDGATERVYYLKRPFQKAPDHGACSVNYKLKELLDRAEEIGIDS